MKKLMIFLFLNCILKVSFAQVSYGGSPILFNDNFLRGSSSIEIVEKVLPYVDNDRSREDAEIFAEERGYGKTKFYGFTMPVNIDIKTSSSQVAMADSGKVYLYQITSPSAYAIQLLFSRFNIPKGARMFIYNPEKSEFMGSFTELNNSVGNTFGTVYFPGNSLIIEYYEPNNSEFQGEVFLEEIVHCFVNVSRSGSYALANRAPCQKDINCIEGAGWEILKRSVAIILSSFTANNQFKYWGHCTGTLLNNTAEDGEPYLLTAMHCTEKLMESGLSFFENVQSMMFIFEYEAPSCGGEGGSSAIYNKSVYGARVLSRDIPKVKYENGYYDLYGNSTDYALLKLNVTSSVLTLWKVVYAGWEADLFKIPKGKLVCIHHPMGDYKSISVSNKNIGTANLESGMDNAYWSVKWSVGTTEKGSSGSPLFNSDYKVIGQLWGGASGCSNDVYNEGPDFFGNFSISYHIHGIRSYLNPLNVNTTSMGYYNPSNVGEHCYNKVKDVNETGVDCGGPDCPPCGYSMNHCFNGKKDEKEGETGIDCGGPCRPCGGAVQCSNCKRDGDEEGIDCGGSCKPCTEPCNNKSVITFGSNSTLPKVTKVNDRIETSGNIVVNNGQTVQFEAKNSIRLGNGFQARVGSNFTAKIQPCICKPVCSIERPNAYVFNNNPDRYAYYLASGYNRFNIEVVNRNGTSIFRGNGIVSVYGEADVWNGRDNSGKLVSPGTYYMKTTFYSDCLGISTSNTQDLTVFIAKSISSENYAVDLDNMLYAKDKISVYPNPFSDYFIIEHSEMILNIQLIDSNGKIIIGQEINQEDALVKVPPCGNGIYFLKILDTNGKIFLEKLIKKE